MKEKLLGKEVKERFHLKKVYEIYTDALAQTAQCYPTRAKILSNRALLQMWVRNYGKAVEDCLNAIALDEKFMRPYCRACESLLKLHMYEKAIKLADRGLKIEFIKELKELRDEAVKQHSSEVKKRQSKEKQKSVEDMRVVDKCREWGLVLGELSDYPLPQVYSRKLVFDEEVGGILFPILFIYPEFGQFDYVQQMYPDEPMWGTFLEIFKATLPWDAKGFYLKREDVLFAIKVELLDGS